MPEPKGLSPVERTLWMMRTRPDVLNHMAWNLWWGQSREAKAFGYRQDDAKVAWDGYPDATRQEWRDRATAKMEAHAEMGPAERAMEARTGLLRVLARNDEVAATMLREDEIAVEIPLADL